MNERPPELRPESIESPRSGHAVAPQDVPFPGSDVATLLASARDTRKRRRRIFMVSLAFIVSAGGYRFFESMRTPEPTVRYVTADATLGPLTVKVSATGTLQPVTQVEVGTEVSGTVESVMVDFNDKVTVGQVLARLDTTQLAAKERQSGAALRLAEARAREARATVVETRSKLVRLDALIAKRLAAAEEHDTLTAAHARAVSGVAVAEAQIQQARAQLEYDQRLLEKAVVHAPITGIVLKRQVEPGQTVAASLQTPVLFTLAENLTQMELHVQVDEADVGKVVAGQAAEFVVDAYPNRRFPAVITLVRYVPQTVDGVVTYETLLTVDNSNLLLRPGMTVTAEILIKQHVEVVRVPNAALRFSPPIAAAEQATPQNATLVSRLMWRPRVIPKRVPEETLQGARVWTLRDGVPMPVPVATGATDGIMTEITAGELVPGTAVIIEANAAAITDR